MRKSTKIGLAILALELAGCAGIVAYSRYDAPRVGRMTPIRGVTPEQMMEMASSSYDSLISKYGNEGVANILMQISDRGKEYLEALRGNS